MQTNIWTNVEVTVTIMAACIPMLRAFLKEKISSNRSDTSQESSSRFRTHHQGRVMMQDASNLTTTSNPAAAVTGDLEINEKGDWRTSGRESG